MLEITLNTNKGCIHYWKSDSWKFNTDTLFFLHGLTADHRMFENQTSEFESKYNILVWDAPAHGKSRSFDEFDFKDVSEYMKSILEENDVRNVVLIGQSLGGFFAQAFIKRYPNYVKGFISVDSTPYGHAYYSKTDIWILKQIEWMAFLCPFQWMKQAMAKQVSATAEAYANMVQMLEPYGKRELCHLMGLCYANFLEDNCDLDIPCPVLLIMGEFDKTGKVKQYNKEWTKRTGYPLEIIKGAAHNSNVDKPQQVNECIRKFLMKIMK